MPPMLYYMSESSHPDTPLPCISLYMVGESAGRRKSKQMINLTVQSIMRRGSTRSGRTPFDSLLDGMCDHLNPFSGQ